MFRTQRHLQQAARRLALQSSRPAAALPSLRTLGATPARSMHAARPVLQEEMDAEALKAKAKLMREAAKKKREEEAARKAAEEAANPTPKEGEDAAAAESSTASATASGDASAAADPSASSTPSPPTQPQVNRLWSLLRQEMRHLSEHVEAKRKLAAGPGKKAKQRPVVQRSRISYKEWSSDPEAEAAAAKQQMEEEAEAKESDEAEAKEYTGPTALQAVDTETVWDKRLNAWKERLRYFGVAMPKKAIRATVAQSKQLSELSERVTERLDEAKEQWEVSQDPRVWRMRDMVDRVAGETETGMALGELMAADPHFNQLDFLRDMEETMIPEVIHAFRIGDMKLLKQVTEGTAAQAVFASFRQRDEQKVEWDPRTLDVRGVDIVKASIHNDVPFIHLTFVCQHVAAEYDQKTGEIKDPLKASVVQNTYYSWAMRRDYESPYYDWKIFEFQYQHIQALI